METNQPLDSGFSEGQVNNLGKDYLLSASKWTKFISIFYFIILGLSSIMALLSMAALASVGGGAMIFSLLFMVGILGLAFYVTICLYRFSSSAERAAATDNTAAYTEAFKNLNSFFKITGIMLIIVIIFYALTFLLFGGMALSGAGSF